MPSSMQHPYHSYKHIDNSCSLDDSFGLRIINAPLRQKTHQSIELQINGPVGDCHC